MSRMQGKIISSREVSSYTSSRSRTLSPTIIEPTKKDKAKSEKSEKNKNGHKLSKY